MIDYTKSDLVAAGRELMERFCAANEIETPAVEFIGSKEWQYSVCAYYRRSKITMCLAKCAPVGLAGASWSYPGYCIDRTPYGVIQHELGHHVDVLRSTQKGPYYGDFSIILRKASGEPPITTYAPNDAEWFAEMFRVFVTNPGLLTALRPRTHAELAKHFKPVVDETWEQVLHRAPDRTVKQVKKKIGDLQQDLLC